MVKSRIEREDDPMRSIPAGEFKAKCLKIMDEVAATGEPVLVTKRGKPVVSVTVPTNAPRLEINLDSIFNFMQGTVAVPGDPDQFVDPIIPLEEWNHLDQDEASFPPK